MHFKQAIHYLWVAGAPRMRCLPRGLQIPHDTRGLFFHSCCSSVDDSSRWMLAKLAPIIRRTLKRSKGQHFLLPAIQHQQSQVYRIYRDNCSPFTTYYQILDNASHRQAVKAPFTTPQPQNIIIGFGPVQAVDMALYFLVNQRKNQRGINSLGSCPKVQWEAHYGCDLQPWSVWAAAQCTLTSK